MDQIVMYQQWHHILFLHWKVALQDLRPHIPKDFEIETWNGEAFLGMVLFTMSGVRPRFLPAVSRLSAFHEFNVRTYVRHRDRAGVWFFSLDAANLSAVSIARSRYHLPYQHARMAVDRNGLEVVYKSSRLRGPGEIRARARISGQGKAAVAGGLNYFLIERYRLFTKYRGTVYSLKVAHDPYLLRPVDSFEVDETLSRAAGFDVMGLPIANFADGVAVSIGRLHRV
jgi:uncharacterized protein YqjF (DUF2071 family)